MPFTLKTVFTYTFIFHLGTVVYNLSVYIKFKMFKIYNILIIIYKCLYIETECKKIPNNINNYKNLKKN